MLNRSPGFAGAQTSVSTARTVRAMKPITTVELLNGQTHGDVADNVATLLLEQVAQLSGVGTAELTGLVDFGVLTPIKPVSACWAFRLDCVMTLQYADHIRHDLALDNHGFALAMMLLSQITGLESELRPGPADLHTLRVGAPLERRAN